MLNCVCNRDPMAHAHVNFTRSGLPIKEMKHIAKVTWGDESAVDQIGDYTPTNAYKMKRLQWVIARTEPHNKLGLYSWMAPWEYCPDEKNQYVGDPNMEAKIFSAVTGVNKTVDDLDKDGIRAWLLQRVYTMRQLGSSNMRKDHDMVPGWIYTDPKDKPFQELSEKKLWVPTAEAAGKISTSIRRPNRSSVFCTTASEAAPHRACTTKT